MNRTLVTASFLAAAAAQAPAQDLSLTVYNNDLALVRDTRRFTLESGINEIRVADVAARIDPTSVLLSGDGLQVREQNFEYDLASAERILDRYLDREVTAIMESGETFSGTLVSYVGGLVLVSDARTTVLTRDRVERIDFPELPGGLTTRPTLVWSLAADRAGDQSARLSYLTRGMQWHAEYVALVNETDTALELSAWVSLENHSGAAYENAQLQLVAGDIHRAPMTDGRRAPQMEGVYAAKAAPQFEEESFFEYHLYTLDEALTIKDRQTKQITLFPTAQVGDVAKTYHYQGGDKIQVMLEFENATAQGLGLALPKGKIRVMKVDERGGAQLLGEDRIDHTPRDETVEVTVGNAFDIRGERIVTDQRQISRRVTEQDVEVTLRNHKDEAVTVRVHERTYGDWDMIRSSHEWEKKSATEILFDVPVEANGESVLTFTLRNQR